MATLYGSDAMLDPSGMAYTGGSSGFDEAAAGRGSAIPVNGGDWFAQFQQPSAGGAQGGDWITHALQQAQSTDDPAYWQRVIAQDPKVAAGDQSAIDYWKMRIAQGDGAAAVRSGQQQPYGGVSSNTVPGTLISPYTGQFSLPSLGDLQGMPGYQAQLDAAQNAVQRSAAAKGTLLTGGTQKDLQDAAIGTAMQNYARLSDLSLGVQQGNYGIFKDNQDRPYSKLFNLSQLGLNASNSAANAGSAYGANTANLQTGQGNANAASTIAQGNTNANVINSLGQVGAGLYDAYQNRNGGTGPIYGPGY